MYLPVTLVDAPTCMPQPCSQAAAAVRPASSPGGGGGLQRGPQQTTGVTHRLAAQQPGQPWHPAAELSISPDQPRPGTPPPAVGRAGAPSRAARLAPGSARTCQPGTFFMICASRCSSALMRAVCLHAHHGDALAAGWSPRPLSCGRLVRGCGGRAGAAGPGPRSPLAARALPRWARRVCVQGAPAAQAGGGCQACQHRPGGGCHCLPEVLLCLQDGHDGGARQLQVPRIRPAHGMARARRLSCGRSPGQARSRAAWCCDA